MSGARRRPTSTVPWLRPSHEPSIGRSCWRPASTPRSRRSRRPRRSTPYVSRVLRLTLLAPAAVEAILDGRASAAPTLAETMKVFPVEWSEQGFYRIAQDIAATQYSTKETAKERGPQGTNRT